MDMPLAGLETLLRRLGAVDAGAWAAVTGSMRSARYGIERPIRLEAGGLLYVGEGLLKQYVRHGRTQPAINRFIRQGEVYAVPHDPDPVYIKTIQPSTVYCWDSHTLRRLLLEYPSLLGSYLKIRDMQENALDTRLWLLEQTGKAKLALFDRTFGQLRAHLKGKDLGNYLHLAYAYISQIREK
ncbi:hypothetical protein [Parapedobacter sp. 2B3]|uniref:hypothetical protein n=1 Tax=Parapedobacter sp. 2B3 TaxID=3342381 RepID=UPI0035B5E271